MPGLLLFALLAAASAGEPPPTERGGVSECSRSCADHVSAALRGSICGACLGAADGERGTWVLELARVRPYPADELEALGRDPDWQVRWGAVRVGARHAGVSEQSALATRVRSAVGPDVLPAAVMAAHVLARKGQSSPALATMGRDGPPAAARLWSMREQVRAAIELELFGGGAGARARSLGELATFLGRTPARVALDALASRPAAADAEVAQALRTWCTRHRQPLASALLEAARPADQARVDRLLAVYARELDRLRGQLRERDAAQQRAAARELRAYLPMSEPELRAALLAPDQTVALAAAEALVGEEPGALVRYAEARAPAWSAGASDRTNPERTTGEGTTGERPEVVARWVSLAVRVSPGRCLARLAPLVRSPEASVRAAVAAALVSCPAGQRPGFAVLVEDRDPEVRLAAVRLLGDVPPGAGGPGLLERARHDRDPRVVAQALRLLSGRPGANAAPALRSGLDHPDAEVRAAAVRALGERGSTQDATSIVALLARDPAAEVRVAAAVALGLLGGPAAVSALVDAAGKDPDGHVRYVAKDSLRRLGFQR